MKKILLDPPKKDLFQPSNLNPADSVIILNNANQLIGKLQKLDDIGPSYQILYRTTGQVVSKVGALSLMKYLNDVHQTPYIVIVNENAFPSLIEVGLPYVQPKDTILVSQITTEIIIVKKNGKVEGYVHEWQSSRPPRFYQLKDKYHQQIGGMSNCYDNLSSLIKNNTDYEFFVVE